MYFEKVDSILMSEKKLPVLIVAYCRVSQISKLLETLQKENRRVYIAIDKAPQELFNQNKLVIDCAISFKSKLDLKIRLNEVQAGVKFGVGNAIDWVFEFEESCIILEDDCDITIESLDYLDQMSKYLGEKIALISADSPWFPYEKNINTLSVFPLIWGWTTNRFQWTKLRSLIGGKIPWRGIFITIIKNPNLVVPILFFLAAQIRVKKGRLQAWDCSVALYMLLENMKCIIPNVRLVENVGNDEFAHHTHDFNDVNRSHKLESRLVSLDFSTSKANERHTSTVIRKRIYKMKWFHAFSPIKALLRLQ
jgi:hypothetical protein